MKTRLVCLSLLVLLLPLAACGEIPTPAAGDYPPPQTPLAGVSPVGGPSTTQHPPMVIVDVPVVDDGCIPVPSESERAAVLALGMPATIDFTLQWVICQWAQHGIPSRTARVVIKFDPSRQTISTAVALTRQYGMEVHGQSADRSRFDGVIPLDAIPQLAAQEGITGIRLLGSMPLEPYSCPTPGGPTPIPITLPPGHSPL